MIADSFACRRGHGTHAALRKARAWARTYRWWVRLDVARFFPTIDHGLVREHLRARRPLTRPLRALCERILAAGWNHRHAVYVPGDDLFAPPRATRGSPAREPHVAALGQPLPRPRRSPREGPPPPPRLPPLHGRHAPLARRPRALDAIARAVEDACQGLRLRLHPWERAAHGGGRRLRRLPVMPDQVRVRRTSVNRALRRLRWQLRCAAATSATRRCASAAGGVRALAPRADSWRLRARTLRRLGLLAGDDTPGGDR